MEKSVSIWLTLTYFNQRGLSSGEGTVSKMGIHIRDCSKWGTMKINVCKAINHPYFDALYMLNIDPLMFELGTDRGW